MRQEKEKGGREGRGGIVVRESGGRSGGLLNLEDLRWILSVIMFFLPLSQHLAILLLLRAKTRAYVRFVGSLNRAKTRHSKPPHHVKISFYLRVLRASDALLRRIIIIVLLHAVPAGLPRSHRRRLDFPVLSSKGYFWQKSYVGSTWP